MTDNLDLLAAAAVNRDDLEAADVATAARFVADNRNRFAYHPAGRRWLTYTDGVWTEDDDRVRARHAAEQVARNLLIEAAAERDPDRAKARAKDARQAMNARRLIAMLDVAAPHLSVSTDQLDADPWLLNATNGAVDLRTGDLLEHDPARMLTRQAGAAYQPDAAAPTWTRFLARVLPDDDVRAFLRRLVGFGLVGEQREHVLPIAHGTGANGKSTLLGAVGRTLGSYAGKISVGQLVGRGGNPTGATPELLALRGRRFVVADEPEAGAKLREAQVKALTGGDRIVARGLYAPPVEFQASHLLWIVTNHRPAVEGTDDGIWRRLLLLPFEVHVPAAEQDPELPAKLAAEVDGILAWAVGGCLEWQQRGLDPPDLVRRATDGWRAEADHLAAFIEDECITSAAVSCRAGELYAAYERWANETAVDAMSMTAFGIELTSRGYPKGRSNSSRSRVGIALRDEFGGDE